LRPTTCSKKLVGSAPANASFLELGNDMMDVPEANDFGTLTWQKPRDRRADLAAGAETSYGEAPHPGAIWRILAT
jgi:hypothetical protein